MIYIINLSSVISYATSWCTRLDRTKIKFGQTDCRYYVAIGVLSLNVKNDEWNIMPEEEIS